MSFNFEFSILWFLYVNLSQNFSLRWALIEMRWQVHFEHIQHSMEQEVRQERADEMKLFRNFLHNCPPENFPIENFHSSFLNCGFVISILPTASFTGVRSWCYLERSPVSNDSNNRNFTNCSLASASWHNQRQRFWMDKNKFTKQKQNFRVSNFNASDSNFYEIQWESLCCSQFSFSITVFRLVQPLKNHQKSQSRLKS